MELSLEVEISLWGRSEPNGGLGSGSYPFRTPALCPPARGFTTWPWTAVSSADTVCLVMGTVSGLYGTKMNVTS